MRLPATAPYDTADFPSSGPPCSFTVTLALSLLNAAYPTIGLRVVASVAAARRVGSFPASRAWVQPASAPLVPTRRALLLEAVAAIHRLVATRLERDARLATAVAARRGEHLALTASVSATATTTAAVPAARISTATAAPTTLRAPCGAIVCAAGRRVLETAAGVELLLAGRPDELLAAVTADQGLVLKAHGTSQSSRPTSSVRASRKSL